MTDSGTEQSQVDFWDVMDSYTKRGARRFVFALILFSTTTLVRMTSLELAAHGGGVAAIEAFADALPVGSSYFDPYRKWKAQSLAKFFDSLSGKLVVVGASRSAVAALPPWRVACWMRAEEATETLRRAADLRGIMVNELGKGERPGLLDGVVVLRAGADLRVVVKRLRPGACLRVFVLETEEQSVLEGMGVTSWDELRARRFLVKVKRRSAPLPSGLFAKRRHVWALACRPLVA